MGGLLKGLNEGLTDGEAAFIGGLFGSLVVTILVCAIIYYVLFVIAGWKIFEKAGEKGWKSLIPIYNIYIMYKIVKMEKWFFITLAASLVASMIATSMGINLEDPSAQLIINGSNIFGFLLLLAVGVLGAVISIIQYVRLSRAFQHGTGFAVGLILLSSLFFLILGFDDSKYDKKYVKSLK